MKKTNCLHKKHCSAWKDNDEPVVISANNLVYPYQYQSDHPHFIEQKNFENFIFNASYSTEIYKLPPLPKVKAIIDMQMVKFVVYNKTEEIRSCYNSALRKKSTLTGTLELSWFIDGKGKASGVRPGPSTLNDKELLECITTRIKVWKFPASKNGNSFVQFPFVFTFGHKK